MSKINYSPCLPIIVAAVFLLAFESCKKDSKSSTGDSNLVVNATPVKMGLYEYDTSIYRQLYMEVASIGTTNTEYDLLFDTGSGGMVLDADGIVPKAQITTNGFTFTTDSLVVNGITIMNQKGEITYGDDDSSKVVVSGNLAYADVKMGDNSGTITVKRLPFFLYYKAVQGNGTQVPVHEFDTFGVSPEYDMSFANNVVIQSPFFYNTPGTGLTSGFKMPALGLNNFSTEGYFVPGVLSIGLTSSDLASSSGYILHQLTFQSGDGYAPILTGTLNYTGKTISAQLVFDTGTTPYSVLEDRTSTYKVPTLLPVNTQITLGTNQGFTDSYSITATNNLSYIENPTYSGSSVSIIGLSFFLTNSFLTDYAHHQLGVKNN